MTTATLICDGKVMAVEASLRPDPDCPLAVILDIVYPDGQSATWWISRGLLSAGIGARSGLADVIVRPGRTTTEVLVHFTGQDDDGRESCAILSLPLSQVTAVLAASRPAMLTARRWLAGAVDDAIARCLA